ncbi:MAG: flagellar protein FlgN [Oceanospirillales bacterium]|nr:flagellar protein FlgN [Oceanospirillales bacterium]
MSNPPDTSKLHPLIEEGVELLCKLESTLFEERTALEKRSLEEIQQLTASKSSLLSAIQENFSARHALMSAQGIELSSDGWSRYLSTLPTPKADELDRLWKRLSETLERVQQESQVNQQIILRGQESTERLLSLLQGKNQKSQLYGSSGKSNSFSTQNHIGKA